MDRLGQHAARVARTFLAVLIGLSACCATIARAEFTTVINSPPVEFGSGYGIPVVGSNTQLNLFAGAVISGLAVGHPFLPNDNIEVNLDGGTIEGSLNANWNRPLTTNVVVNVRSGTITGWAKVDNGNKLNVSGGTIGEPYGGGVQLTRGSMAQITGGEIAGYLELDSQSVATVSGGLTTTMWLQNGSDLTMTGGRVGSDGLGGDIVFESASTGRISGGEIQGGVHVKEASRVAVSGGVLGRLGVSDHGAVDVRGGAVGAYYGYGGGRMNLFGGNFRLDGVSIQGLATPGSSIDFNIPDRGVLTGVLADGTAVILTRQGYASDSLNDESLTLVSAPVPGAVPRVFHSPGAAVPHSLRTGQRLELQPGGAAPVNFRVSWGSSVRIAGGEVGSRFRAAGAVIDLVDGKIGELAVLTMGSVLNVSGGSVGSNLDAANGSAVNITGGTMGESFAALSGSRVSITGGAVESYFFADVGSDVAITGSGFRIDGVHVSGMTAIGESRQVDLPPHSVLSGTYADGRPFAFSQQSTDSFGTGVLTLKSVAPPAATPGIIHVDSSVAPVGLHSGQFLRVSPSGVVGDNFNADWGSVVNVEGGRVGRGFEAVGALVNVTGGAFGPGFHAFYGTACNISGGNFAGQVQAGRGSIINISGGQIDGYLDVAGGALASIGGDARVAAAFVHDGGALTVSGGRVGLAPYIMSGATLNVSGGDFTGEVFIGEECVLNASGGTWGDRISVSTSAKMLVTGRDFRVDGELVTDLSEYWPSTPITIPKGSVFSGTFQDGTPFAFSDLDNDYLGEGAIRVAQAYDAPPGPPVVTYAGISAPTGAQRGQAIFVDAQHSLGDNFVAGWGSSVTMTGGAIGSNFEAVGAQVLIAGGVVGERFDAFVGSEVMIMGGSIGREFTAHNGSIVNIVGGQIGSRMTLGEGAVVNVLGGEFDDYIFCGPNSELHIVATDFALNGSPIPGFGPGQTMTLLDIADNLTGRFGDGTEFDVGIIREIWDAPFSPTLLTLTWGLAGDFDNDADVDAADLAAWYGINGSRSTGNDFLAWQRQLGARVAPVNHPVPEPAAWALVCVALLAFRANKRARLSR